MSAWENYHLEWSPDPLSVTNPSWLDLTPYALAPSGPPIHDQGGVPPMGTTAQSATLAASLMNNDHRFTFGNTSSPLYPNWKPGRRLRCYETVGSRRFDLFSGFMRDPPETDDWAEQGADQYMAITAVDRLGWLGTSRAMISTLAEHIIYNGGTSLVGLWPLLESGSAPFYPAPTTPQQILQLSDGSTFGFPATLNASTSSVAQIGGGASIPGDDKATLRFTPIVSGGAYTYFAEINSDINSVTLTSGNTLTFSMWVYPEDPAPAQDIVVSGIVATHGSSGDGFQLQRFGGAWSVGFFLGASAPNVSFPGLFLNAWNHVSMRMSIPSGLCEVWFNGITSGYTTTIGSPPASSQPIDRLYVGGPLQGNVAYAQIYMGTGYTAATHSAQYAAGLSGLTGQLTGDRITTLAQYAGIPATELGLVDRGTSQMQKATLAGQTPLAEMRIAETTEQGRLRTSGQGLLVFDPRTRRYNR